jgi:hypothetical protein
MLHVPVGTNTFGLTQASWGTTRPAAANGTSVTPVVGSKGSWASMVTATTADAYGILININSNSASAASRQTVVDIGIDEAGGTSYVVAIADLLAGGAPAYTVGAQWYFFPLYIPAGAHIAARAQSSVTTAFRVGCQLLERPSNPAQIRKGSFVETLGVSGVAGTTIVPGTTNKGSWTLIGTTVERLWWWQAAIQIPTTDTAWNAQSLHVDLAVGDGVTYDTIISDLAITMSTAEILANPPLTAGVEWSVPPGSSIYMRAQSSGTLDVYQAAAYGLGG